MATSQSGKRKLIPHAQKDGSSAWKEREEEEEIQRDEGSRIEPDEVKETPPPPLSFTTLSFPRSTSRPTDDLQPRRRRRSKVFSRGGGRRDCKHRETLVGKTLPAKINRLWRCRMKYACA